MLMLTLLLTMRKSWSWIIQIVLRKLSDHPCWAHPSSNTTKLRALSCSPEPWNGHEQPSELTCRDLKLCTRGRSLTTSHNHAQCKDSVSQQWLQTWTYQRLPHPHAASVKEVALLIVFTWETYCITSKSRKLLPKPTWRVCGVEIRDVCRINMAKSVGMGLERKRSKPKCFWSCRFLGLFGSTQVSFGWDPLR